MDIRTSLMKSPWLSLAATLIAALMGISYYGRLQEESRASDPYVFWIWVVITGIWLFSFIVRLRKRENRSGE